MSAHIEKCKLKNGTCWRVIVESGTGPDGKRKRIYRNVKGTKKEAEALMAQLLSELNNGTFIEPARLSVADYLNNWLDSYVKPNLSPTTIDSYTVNIEKHLIPRIGHIQLQKLAPMHVQNLYQDLLENGRSDGSGGLSPRSVAYVHSTLHEALLHAVRLQLVPRNVAALVSPPRVKKYKAAIYSPEELFNLLQVSSGTDMELPIVLAAALGLRRGEVLGLQWSDVDLATMKLSVTNNRVPTKNGNINKAPKSASSIRTIDLPAGIIPILKRHKAIQAENRLKLGKGYCDGNYVYCQSNGFPYSPGYLSRKFSAFLTDHGLKKIRFHDLRHSHATLLLACGVQAKVASERLGHGSIGITMDLYSHVIESMQKDAAEKINLGIFDRPIPDKVSPNNSPG